MKLMPASSARWIMRIESCSSVGPPNIIAPRQSGDTLIPARPKFRYSMAPSLPDRFMHWGSKILVAGSSQLSRMETQVFADLQLHPIDLGEKARGRGAVVRRIRLHLPEMRHL